MLKPQRAFIHRRRVGAHRDTRPSSNPLHALPAVQPCQQSPGRSTDEYFWRGGIDSIILNLEDCRCRSITLACHHHLELGRLQVASDLRAEARADVDFRSAEPYARVRFRPRGDPVGDACTACPCRHGRFRLPAGIWDQRLELPFARDVKAGQVILLGPIDDATC